MKQGVIDIDNYTITVFSPSIPIYLNTTQQKRVHFNRKREEIRLH